MPRAAMPRHRLFFQYLPYCEAYMHNVCYLHFAVSLEAQECMACIFREWYMQPISRQNRAEKVLRLMRIWMRRAFESGVQRRSVECCFQQWKVEAGLDHPGMVQSSSEEILPAINGNVSTSSSDSDATLPLRFVSPGLFSLFSR